MKDFSSTWVHKTSDGIRRGKLCGALDTEKMGCGIGIRGNQRCGWHDQINGHATNFLKRQILLIKCQINTSVKLCYFHIIHSRLLLL